MIDFIKELILKIISKFNQFFFVGSTDILPPPLEKEEELEILSTEADLDCDVLKVGHHGSSTSSCKEFLAEASPEICVIQVGENNDYGHPHSSAVKRLKKHTENIYRNDICGDIVITSDGENISVEYENM